MSGWDAYVQTQLLATGIITEAGIFGKGDMQLYASGGGFQLRPQYTATVTANDGSETSATIDEAAALVAYFNGGKKPQHGFRMNGVKYQLMREMQEGPVLVLKCTGGGACVAATNTLVIVGVYKQDKSGSMDVPIQCNKAVEDLAEYLRSNQY